MAGRYRHGMLIGGAALVALAFLAIGFTAWQDSATLASIRLVPALVLIGIGSGFFMPPLLNAILSSVPGPDSGAASGLAPTMPQTGSAVGSAVVGLLVLRRLGAGGAGSQKT